ncbi:MAG: Tol-Pal system beta propeller repeat protein TolB [candidate division Zixibacteria bacterium]|nr:Tol-Pal system beta propeller repeat protein TolB [candidate division Zixibacteria bacterium]
MEPEKPRGLAPLFIIIISLLVICLGWFIKVRSAQGQSDFYGVIRDSGGEVPQLNIAVANFDIGEDFYGGNGEEKSNEFRKLIEKGLDFSLYFNVVSADSSLMALIGQRSINYDDWIFLGAEHLVDGKFSSDGVRYHFNLELIDIPRGKSIYRTDFHASIDSLNQLAYTAVDRIINILTGEKGISASKIIFSVNRGMAKELYLCNWDGHDGRFITDNGSINLFPAVSPAGDNIYFTSYIRGNPDLFKLEINSRNMNPISARKGINSSPAVSPDGKYIALTLTVDGNAELYLIRSDGRIVRRLTKSWGIESSPSFSPSGREIVFSSDRSGNVHLYVTDVDGLNQRRLTYHGNYNDTPSWSPKGDRIVYASRENGRFQIYSISITGEDVRRLTTIGTNQDPCFSPDGLHICFVSDRNGYKEIYTMNFDGSDQKRITDLRYANNPYWFDVEK